MSTKLPTCFCCYPGLLMPMMMLKLGVICLLGLQGCLAYNKTLYSSIEAETKLIHDLLVSYDRRVRPVQKPSDTVHASFGIGLKAVLFLDEKQEYMETVSYMLTAWHDGRLMWNSSQYMGIDSIKIPASDIWRPDFVPYTSIDEDVHLMDTMAAVYASGHVSWIPTLHLRSPCAVKLRSFPFDQQKCTVRFASYVYHGDLINITYFGGSPDTAFDVSDYMSNTNWALVDHKVTINVIKHTCCPEPYPHMQLDLVLKRNPDYYVHLFVLPALLLGFLVPVTYLMPPESQERVTIGSIVILSLILLNIKLCDILPLAHDELPALSMYYTLSIMWTALSLTGSVFVLNIHNRGPRRGKVPEILRWIFLRSLKRLVLLGNDSYYPLTDFDTISMRGLDKTLASQERQGADLRGANTSKLEREMEELNCNEARQDILNEWRQVALVMDRVLFFLFLLMFLLCSVILLA
ncbi:hypothetical protein BsWGS_13138 [Bradybaena similaris]